MTTYQLVTTSGVLGFSGLDEVVDFIKGRSGIGVEMKRAEIEVHDSARREGGKVYASTLVETLPIPSQVLDIIRLWTPSIEVAAAKLFETQG